MYRGNELQASSSGILLLNVEDLLSFAHIKAGTFEKHEHRFNIKKAVEDVIGLQAYQASSKDI